MEKNDVIDNNLLGVDTAIALNMLKIGEAVNQTNTNDVGYKYSNLKLRYKSCFSGLRKLSDLNQNYMLTQLQNLLYNP